MEGTSELYDIARDPAHGDGLWYMNAGGNLDTICDKGHDGGGIGHAAGYKNKVR